MIYALDSPIYRSFLTGRSGNKTTEFGGVRTHNNTRAHNKQHNTEQREESEGEKSTAMRSIAANERCVDQRACSLTSLCDALCCCVQVKKRGEKVKEKGSAGEDGRSG